MVYFGYLAIASVAGKETLAQIAVKFLANVTVSNSIAYMVGAGGVAYGVMERRQQRRKNAKLTSRIRELEERIDPGRSSSKTPPDEEVRR